MIPAFRRAGVLWAVIGLLLLFWLGSSAISNHNTRSDYKRAQKHAQVMDHFWQVVAGKDPGQEETVTNKLGRDLRVLTPQGLFLFRGDSNVYGGISSEMGFDPFNGPNCSECGPLDPDIIAQAIKVKDGGLKQVIAREQPPKPHLTGGPAAFSFVLWVLALPIMFAAISLGHNRAQGQRYKDMSGEVGLVHQMDKALEGTFDNPQDRADLQVLRNKLMDQIDTRVKYGQRAKQTMQLDRLKQEATDSLSSIEQGNKTLTS